MNKKYLYTVITASALALTMGSCEKYLDQQPITEVTTPAVFNTVDGAFQALIGAYTRLAGQEGYGQRLSLYYTVDTDEMQGPTGTDDERRNIARYQPTPNNTGLQNPFAQIFQGIEFANNCIDNIPKMAQYTSGTEQEKKKLQRMYGEALTLRAQFYFEGIKNWGDLPEHFTAAANLAVNNPFPSRVNRDSLYIKILADLQEATTLVPWRDELTAIGDVEDERITKGTIKGVRARIALFMGGYSLRQQTAQMERRSDYLTYYQIARQECLDIITAGKNSLNPDYKALWRDQVCKKVVLDPNNELMFQVGSIGGVGVADSRLGFYDGPRVGTFGNAAINVLPTYFYLFDSTDTRRDVTIAPYNVAATGNTKIGLTATAINTGKFRRDWNTSIAPTFTGQFLGLKFQLLRYADILLMFAEAENEINGATAPAYDALNRVRRRGYGKPISTADATVDIPSGLSKSQFFAALVRERSLEFGSEGLRKYDLLRWNLLQAALAETKVNLGRIGVAAPAPLLQPTYMAGYPTYVINNTLPLVMYFKNNNTADDASLWFNSFYRTAPGTTPAGTTRVTWLSAAIATTSLSRFATGFTPGRSELFPIPTSARNANFNLSQNPNY